MTNTLLSFRNPIHRVRNLLGHDGTRFLLFPPYGGTRRNDKHIPVISNPDSSGEKSFRHDGTRFLLLTSKWRVRPSIRFCLLFTTLQKLLSVGIITQEPGFSQVPSSQFPVQINSCHNSNNLWHQPLFLARNNTYGPF